jgi:hypothetical protein
MLNDSRQEGISSKLITKARSELVTYHPGFFDLKYALTLLNVFLLQN